jgi:hypothetical protein
VAFVDSYPYQKLVTPHKEQLDLAKEKLRLLQSTGPALSREQLTACHGLEVELSSEWNKLESKLHRLDTLRNLSSAAARFLKWNAIFLGIIWLVDLFVFPLIIYYLNAFLAGFEVSYLPSAWSYQKSFLIVGTMVGIAISIFVAAKDWFKHK